MEYGDTIELTVATFRTDFSAFASETTYTDAALSNSIDRASSFVSIVNAGCLKDGNRLYALELMTAHLQILRDKITSGAAQGGLVGSSSVGDVSVSLIAPPSGGSQYRYWMNQTAYGQEFLALMATCSPAGIYAGGSCQRVLR